MENIIQMEEKTKIFYLGQELALSLKQIISLQPLVKQEDLKKLKLPSSFNKFEINYQVLHSCLYYLVSIEKEIYSLTASNFRQKCLAAIQNYYIEHKMNFQLYDYGYLCSKLLSYSLEKSLHIIYFLVYARLASKPYILSVINQAEKFRKVVRKQTCRSQKDESAVSNQRESRHLTVYMQNSQIQVQSFKKDLKKIFNSQADLKKFSKKTENKRYFNLKKLYPQQNYSNKFEQPDDQLSMKNTFAGRALKIPLKVGPNDHSSVINRLKFHSGKACVGQNSDSHKHMARRQKFKDQFNGCEKYQSFKRQEKQEQKQWGTQKGIGDDKIRGTASSNMYRFKKNPYQYFREVAHNIKSSNKQLDLIRTECINNLIKSNFVNKQEQFCNYAAASLTGVNTPKMMTTNSQKWSLNLAQLKLQDKQNAFQTGKLRQQGYRAELSSKKEQSKLMSEATPRINDLLNGIITRKNDKTNQQDEKIMLFHKTVKSKFKLQKYKEQYRHFLKNQLFEKDKNIV